MTRWSVLSLAILGACAGTTPSVSEDAYRLAMSEGRWADAYVASASALCETPTLERARERVQLWDRVGRPGEPRANLRCELDALLARYIDGLSTAARGQHQRAAELLATAARNALPEDRGELLYRAGVALSLGGHFEDAVAVLNTAAGADPRRIDIRLGLATAQLEALGPAPAIATLRSILSLAPRAREVDRARELLNRAVARSQPPMPPGLDVEVSRILAEIEKDQVSSETAVRLRGQIGQDPHPKLLTVAGLVSMKLGRLAEGSHYLVQAAAANPLDPEPLRSLGTTLYTAGQLERALPHLRDAAERDPFDIDTLKTLAEAAAAVGDIESAAGAYERLVVLEPLNPDHYLWIARMERRRGDLPSARRAAVRGCELVKRNIPLFLERASIEAQIALSASSSAERERASARTRDAVDALLDIAPGHPGAEPILESLEAID